MPDYAVVHFNNFQVIKKELKFSESTSLTEPSSKKSTAVLPRRHRKRGLCCYKFSIGVKSVADKSDEVFFSTCEEQFEMIGRKCRGFCDSVALFRI